MEICPECYPKYFPVYKDMKFEVSKEAYRCSGCGEIRGAVKRVTIGGDIIDVN